MQQDAVSEPSNDGPVTAWLVIVGLVIGVSSLTFGIHRYLVGQAVEEGKPKAEQRLAERTAQDRAQARTDTLQQLLTELSSRVKDHPDDSMLVISAANIAYDLGNFEEAERFYRLFLDNIDADNVSARIDLAYVVYRIGRKDESFTMLHDIIAKNPSNQTAMFNLAFMYDQEGQPDKAKEWMKKCQAADPNSALGQRATQVLSNIETQAPNN